MPTAAALEASKILRDGSLFQWYVISLFALVVYVYAVEIERKNWNLFFAGLAFWGMDWFNEIGCFRPSDQFMIRLSWMSNWNL